MYGEHSYNVRNALVCSIKAFLVRNVYVVILGNEKDIVCKLGHSQVKAQALKKMVCINNLKRIVMHNV